MYEDLIKIYEKEIENFSMKVGIAFTDLQTNESVYYNQNQMFPLASTSKVVIMIALFQQIEKGNISLDDKIKIDHSNLTLFGSGIIQNLSDGLVLTVEDLVNLMMLISDNAATDICYDLVGNDNIKKVINDSNLENFKFDFNIGTLLYKSLAVDPKMPLEQLMAQEEEIVNRRDLQLFLDDTVENISASPKDFNIVLENLFNNKYTSQATTDKMLGIMKNCHSYNRIIKYLPAGVKAAIKSGGIVRVMDEVGIVYTSKGAYACSFFTNGYYSSDEEFEQNARGHVGQELIAKLSKITYDYFMEAHK